MTKHKRRPGPTEYEITIKSNTGVGYTIYPDRGGVPGLGPMHMGFGNTKERSELSDMATALRDAATFLEAEETAPRRKGKRRGVRKR